MTAPKVLILEDSKYMREKLKELITNAGGDIVGEAEDGQEGIDKFRQLNPDIVFIDVIMPNVSGVQALEKMKEINNEAKFIMCTSINQEHLIQETIRKGATDYISKPFRDEEVTEVIKRYLSG